MCLLVQSVNYILGIASIIVFKKLWGKVFCLWFPSLSYCLKNEHKSKEWNGRGAAIFIALLWYIRLMELYLMEKSVKPTKPLNKIARAGEWIEK